MARHKKSSNRGIHFFENLKALKNLVVLKPLQEEWYICLPAALSPQPCARWSAKKIAIEVIDEENHLQSIYLLLSCLPSLQVGQVERWDLHTFLKIFFSGGKNVKCVLEAGWARFYWCELLHNGIEDTNFSYQSVDTFVFIWHHHEMSVQFRLDSHTKHNNICCNVGLI